MYTNKIFTGIGESPLGVPNFVLIETTSRVDYGSAVNPPGRVALDPPEATITSQVLGRGGPPDETRLHRPNHRHHRGYIHIENG